MRTRPASGREPAGREGNWEIGSVIAGRFEPQEEAVESV
jgi:hypothetical protein